MTPRAGRHTLAAPLALLFLLLACAALAPIPPAAPAAAQPADGEQAVEAYLDSVRGSPPLLRAFLSAFPKGGDIHTHLAGAVYAETLIAIAADDDLCVGGPPYQLTSPPCAAGQRPVADAL